MPFSVFFSKALHALSASISNCLDSVFTSFIAELFTLQGEADGSFEYEDFQPGSLNTTKQLIEDLNNIDLVFHIGDIVYAMGYIAQWDQFTAQIAPITSSKPYMIGRFDITCICSLLSLHKSIALF